MKEILNKAQKFTNRHKYLFLIAVLLVLILPFFFAAYYSHPSADDYCLANTTIAQGVIPTELYYYNNWTGRFFSTILITLSPVTFHSNALYKLVPIFLLSTLLLSITFLVFTIFKSKKQKNIFLSLLLFLLILQSLPNTNEGFYWLAGGVTYILPVSMSLMAVAITLRIKKQILRKKVSLLLSVATFVLLFASVGSNETIMAILLLGYLAFFGYKILIDRKFDKLIFSQLIIIVISTVIVLLAPGNSIRLVATNASHDLRFSLINSVLSTISFTLNWATVTNIFVYAMLIATLFTQNLKLNLKSKKILLISMFSSAALLCVSFFPGFWSYGDLPPTRTLNFIYILFVFLFIFNVFILMSFIDISILKGRKIFIALLFTGIVITTLSVNSNIRIVYNDFLTKTFSSYKTQNALRDAELADCNAKGLESCSLTPIIIQPQTQKITSDIVIDKSSWTNQCLAEYNKLKTVDLKH